MRVTRVSAPNFSRSTLPVRTASLPRWDTRLNPASCGVSTRHRPSSARRARPRTFHRSRIVEAASSNSTRKSRISCQCCRNPSSRRTTLLLANSVLTLVNTLIGKRYVRTNVPSPWASIWTTSRICGSVTGPDASSAGSRSSTGISSFRVVGTLGASGPDVSGEVFACSTGG